MAKGIRGRQHTDGGGELLEGGDAEPRHVDGSLRANWVEVREWVCSRVTEEGSALFQASVFRELTVRGRLNVG